MTIDKQTAKLIARITENLPADLDDTTMQGWIENPKGLQNLLRGLVPPAVVAPEPPLDFTVRVDRGRAVTYPDWMKRVLLPFEMETVTGPAEYDLRTQVDEWLHDKQKGSGVVRGQAIYDYLKSTNTFTDQLGLADLLAIQAKGIKVFRALYKGKAVFGWKSVVEYRDGRLCVPFLFEDGDVVVLGWSWLDYVWRSSNPGLRFRK